MKKTVGLFAVITLLSILSFSLISTTAAMIIENSQKSGYKEYYGTMGGANFYILIPNQWTNPLGDGMLVVFCRGASYSEDPRYNAFDYSIAKVLAMQGIAAAASNYGSIDENDVKQGVLRSHQLTMYAIENYGVTGKVFLYGTSMGGSVALLLGEEHPDVYSGVLDLVGTKDWRIMYNDAASYTGSDPFLLYWNNNIVPYYLRIYGGTPEEKPFKYAKDSPIDHTNMRIPVISIVHVNDALCSPLQTTLYHQALTDPSLHQIVYVTTVTPGAMPFPGATGWYGHMDPANWVVATQNLFALIAWSNALQI